MPARDALRRRRAAQHAGLQRLPLLRGLLRGVSGDGAAADVREGGPALSRQPLPQLRRVLLRLPVRAAARVRRQRAAQLRPGAGPRPTGATPGRAFLASLFERNGVVVSLATAAALALFLSGDLLLPGPGGGVRSASGRRLLQGDSAQRNGLDLRRGSALRAARADDRVRPVLARDRRADARVRRAGGARARDRWTRCTSRTSKAAATAARIPTSGPRTRGGSTTT